MKKNNSKDFRPFKSIPSAFAVLDILGYGKMMEKEPEEVLNVIKVLLETPQIITPVSRDIGRFAHFSAKKSPEIEYLVFSDTILMWLSNIKSSPDQFQKPHQLVETISYAVSISLATFMFSGIPIRGGIGYGPIFICKEPLFFTGKELSDVFKFEKQQAWAGVALHSSAEKYIDNPANIPFLLNYTVPLQCDKKKNFIAIDWVSPNGKLSTLSPPWHLLFSNRTDKRVNEKYINTKKFYETVIVQDRNVPITLAEDSINQLRSRIENIQ